MYSIGYDIGSSSIKAALIDMSSGQQVATASYPDTEMKMYAPQEGWAEQDPNDWWTAVCKATKRLIAKSSINPIHIKSIGIAYQMHGLVLIDKNLKPLRPSIIWCDSRAVAIGEKAYSDLGYEYCSKHILNSPGNFTASKLKWVRDNEPDIFHKIRKMLLPGDFIAMQFTGDVNTTIGGLSEGVMWDFHENSIAHRLLDYYGIPERYIPDIVDTFSHQGKVTRKAASESGLQPGTPVTYRAGDQPNNAMSLRVFNPGEVAATGGTSGVVYGVSDKAIADKKSRVNAFAHVNHNKDHIRIGQLLCINGAGSQYAWIKNQIATKGMSYAEMENLASEIPSGSNGLQIIPFGNGAERMLNNIQTGAIFNNVQFNIHTRAHFYRAALEGIAYSFVYGISAMEALGIVPDAIRVGNDNLFQSDIFAKTICNLLGCNIEMMDTTGAIGAAKASRIAMGAYEKPEEAIESTQRVKIYTPNKRDKISQMAFDVWESTLDEILKKNL